MIRLTTASANKSYISSHLTLFGDLIRGVWASCHLSLKKRASETPGFGCFQK